MDESVSFEVVSAPDRKPATYADLENLPENVVGQLIGGGLIAFPRPAAEHGQAAFALGNQLGTPFSLGVGGPGGWWLLFEPELHLGGDVLVPDLAGWRRSSLEAPEGAFISVAPDWLCEVLSPSTARVDRKLKLPVYARAGVGHVWVVDPALRTLEVFRREGDQWLLLATWGDGDRVRAEPFEAAEVDLAHLWPRIRGEAGR